MQSTSAQAFETIKPAIPSLKARVFSAIADAGETGKTPSELISDLSALDYSVRPRVTELLKAGRIKSAGTRQNARGNEEKVFVIA